MAGLGRKLECRSICSESFLLGSYYDVVYVAGPKNHIYSSCPPHVPLIVPSLGVDSSVPSTLDSRERERRNMKQVPVEYLAELEDHGATVAMDVDDVDPLEVFGEGLMAPESYKLADADFFNAFPDDFDDTDVN